MIEITRILLIVVVLAFFKTTFSQESQEILAEEDIFSLSLEELLNVRIVSASNVEESLSRAPATMIVITATDIAERGYIEMYDVLNDLPGFDLSRAFGDDNFYVYARGYRKEASDQMLLMIDGLSMNYLYNNNMHLFGFFPLYNVQQIEVVYGPASAVYGPNAFAGVINIITKKEGNSTVFMSLGQNNTYITEINYNQKFNDVRLNFTARIYDTDGYDLSNRTPALDSRLYNDLNLWGPYQNTDFLGYQSPINSNFFSGSINIKGLTLGFINFLWSSGYGSEWPGDKVLNAKSWAIDEQTYYGRYETNLADNLSSKSLIRFRQSGVPNNALFIERYASSGNFVTDDGDPVLDDQGNPVQTITMFGTDASYWQTTNQSVSFFQDFAFVYSSKLSTNFGFKYDRRTLQGAYGELYGPYIQSDISMTYPFPARPDRGLTEHNHFVMQDKGVYLQGKYSPLEELDVIAGLRYDDNNLFGDVFNPRVGIVYQPMKGLITKLFYGEAYLEPTARALYGGWAGSMSNVNLKPERMRTIEGSVSYLRGNFSNSLNVFYNMGYDVITGNPAQNVGERKMTGVEYAGKAVFNNLGSLINSFKTDLFVSYINSVEDKDDGEGFQVTGNMAPIKVRCILTVSIKNNLSISLQNRWNDEIKTVSSNPIEKINSHFVSDGFIAYRNVFVEGLSLGLKVYNIFNANYFHPGYRSASAGEHFEFDSNNNLIETQTGPLGNTIYNSGSTGWYNSRLPQPMRTMLVNLSLTF